MTNDHFKILMGRMQKLEDLQSRLYNLKNCVVRDGVLPQDIRDKIRSPDGQEKIMNKIKKAERIRFNIALLVTKHLTV